MTRAPQSTDAQSLPGTSERSLALDVLLKKAIAAARLIANDRQGTAPPKTPPSLAGVAPELTGRTGHIVDRRAELYALGAMFYEWATGRPPFQERDPLRRVHEQLTRAPIPPSVLRPELPQAFSDIVMHLLEKEPARRYHSVQGLAHDLQRLRRAMRRGEATAFPVGERDFPRVLVAPKHPLDREREIAVLRRAFDAAARGECRVVLLSGAAGVGKSSLVNELHKIVADANGRFVVGACDPYSRNSHSAVFQALAALGRLLLTEPESELAAARHRLLQALGPEAALACVLPEFKLLLGDLPEPPSGDPAGALPRLGKALLALLRGLASRERPLFVVLDDLHWSLPPTTNFIEDVLADQEMAGLVLVAIYRDTELAPGHPLSTVDEANSAQLRPPQHIRIGNLADSSIAEMLAAMLQLSRRNALRLARAFAAHTTGNPRHTVELVNTLRGDGLLTPHARGWRWEAGALQRYVSHAEVLHLVAARIDRVPNPARTLLYALACVRHDASRALACAACELNDAELELQLVCLEREELVLRELGPRPVLRLLNDQVQQAVYGALPYERRVELHLALARRLDADGSFGEEATDQYLAAADAVGDAKECRRVARLLHRGAAGPRALKNFSAAHRMLDVALSLLARADLAGESDPELQLACEMDLHLTRCGLGLFDEADVMYRRIQRRETNPLRMVEATCAQIGSLHHRGYSEQALGLGLKFLNSLDVEVPMRFDETILAGGFDRLRAWVDTFDATREIARAQTHPTEVVMAAKVMASLCPPAFTIDVGFARWLVLESHALWERHGPCSPLREILGRIAMVASSFGDSRTGYAAGRHLLSFCELRESKHEYSYALHMLSAGSMHWFEPMESVLQQAQRACAGLLAAGDLHTAGLSYRCSSVALLECSPTLDGYAGEVLAGLTLARGTGNAAPAEWLADQQLLAALRGDTSEFSFMHEEFGEDQSRAPKASALGMASYHVRRGVVYGIFGHAQALFSQTSLALACMTLDSSYQTALSHWLHALACAWRLQQSPHESKMRKESWLIELDRSLEWLTGRAADAPANFGHLVLHIRAERAWAMDDISAAAGLFDGALGAVDGLARPWHRALITERAGRFQSSQGRVRQGRQLVNEARGLYQAWGGTAKVAQLSAETGLREGAAALAAPRLAGRLSAADELDGLAVLRASQALGSERSMGRLKAKVEEVLGSLTGATRVVMVLWDEDAGGWVVRPGDGDGEGAAVPVEAAGHLLALSAFRYAERTREALLLQDAVVDDRFARDAYLHGVERCSLMVVPILRQGLVRAMLVLENREARGAFSTARLDAVLMIAGQLAVSLESAQLYERLQRKVDEQTRELRETQSRLLAEARRAGMAQIATNVLHNVGSVLNSVNVSAHVLATRVRQSRAQRVDDLAELLERNAHDLERFFAQDEKGQRLPVYLRELAQALGAEREELLDELRRLGASVDHIKNVVATQQSYAGGSAMLERARITELVNDALRIQEDALAGMGVEVTRDWGPVEPAALDKTRVVQILVNLIENARQAMQDVPGERKLSVAVREEAGWLSVAVRDGGTGIAADNLTRIFSHGFTTKPGGHGFGLHSCALAAKEMGGTLTAYSNGPGTGATFLLRLPVANSVGSAREPGQ